MKQVEIYTDGACSGNPGPGGWAGILSYAGKEKIVRGAEAFTTNNRMELTAVIESLRALKEPCEVSLFTDSAYVCNAILQNWLKNWQLDGWKTANKKQVQNVDLWQQLIELMCTHTVKFNKVKGHSTNQKNNRCDQIARDEIEKLGKI